MWQIWRKLKKKKKNFSRHCIIYFLKCIALCLTGDLNIVQNWCISDHKITIIKHSVFLVQNTFSMRSQSFVHAVLLLESFQRHEWKERKKELKRNTVRERERIKMTTGDSLADRREDHHVDHRHTARGTRKVWQRWYRGHSMGFHHIWNKKNSGSWKKERGERGSEREREEQRALSISDSTLRQSEQLRSR